MTAPTPKLEPAVFPLNGVLNLPLHVRSLTSSAGLKKGNDYVIEGVTSTGLVIVKDVAGLHKMERFVQLVGRNA